MNTSCSIHCATTPATTLHFVATLQPRCPSCDMDLVYLRCKRRKTNGQLPSLWSPRSRSPQRKRRKPAKTAQSILPAGVQQFCRFLLAVVGAKAESQGPGALAFEPFLQRRLCLFVNLLEIISERAFSAAAVTGTAG